jgi:hypothetical protein
MTTAKLDEVERINKCVGDLLRGHYGDDRKTALTLAYLNLSLDHHRAIVLLMRNWHHGSALALVRCVFEAMLRAHWVVACATPAQVDQVAENDDFKFPKAEDIARAVDQALQAEGFFQEAKNTAWKVLNSYTHSGLRQLARQFSEGRVETDYDDQDLVEALDAATASLVLLGHLLAKSTGRLAEAHEIERLLPAGETGV